jgi:hypothetical protein
MTSRSMRWLAVAALCAAARSASATPSTVFWTPATTYTQPFLVPHLTYDTYFAERGSYPIDTGLTIGVIPSDVVQGEVGFDLFYPAMGDAAVYFNGKLSLVEGKLAAWQPGLSVGITSAGVKEDVTNYDMAYAVVSKALPRIGTLAVGGYYGLNDDLWLDVNGDEERAGLLASWTSADVVFDKPILNKVNLFADVQTGKNAFGAAGFGLGVYFTPTVALLTGPVFFLEPDLQAGGSDMMWSMQLDVDLDFRALR